MHYHLEIIMPPIDEDKVEASVGTILAPFDENNEDNTHTFWDWWVIGGRWSGAKVRASLRPEKLEAFHKLLSDEGVTVSGLRCGKEKLDPATQQGRVDQIWREWFPESGYQACPLFEHAGERLPGDVMRLGDVPEGLTCARAILVEADLTALEMLEKSAWNGVSWQDCSWDGSIPKLIEKGARPHAQPKWKEANTPTDDWLVVTVDYHS